MSAQSTESAHDAVVHNVVFPSKLLQGNGVDILVELASAMSEAVTYEERGIDSELKDGKTLGTKGERQLAVSDAGS